MSLPRSKTLFGNDFAAETLFQLGYKQSLQDNLVPKLEFGNQQELIWAYSKSAFFCSVIAELIDFGQSPKREGHLVFPTDFRMI